MIGVIVRKGSNVIEKNIYAGDVSVVPEIVEKLKVANPSLSYAIHSDEDKDWRTSFEDVLIAPMQTTDQVDWQIAKGQGAASALSFIAKRIGLE